MVDIKKDVQVGGKDPVIIGEPFQMVSWGQLIITASLQNVYVGVVA